MAKEMTVDTEEPSTPPVDIIDDMLRNYMEISCGIAWIMLALCLLGIVSNTISIVVYTHVSMRRAPINILLTGLSAIDLCLSFLSIPAFVIPGFYAYYQTTVLNILMCYSSVYVYPLTAMTHTASVWTFVIIAVERWQAVCWGGGGGGRAASASNGRHQSLLRQKRWRSSAIALTVVCLASFAYNFVRFLEFRLVYEENDEEPAANGSSSSVAVTPPTDPSTRLIVAPLLKNVTVYPAYMSVYYVGLFLVSHFVAPFIALLVFNGLTLRAVYVARQRRRRILTRRERKEHRTTWMMVAVMVIFVVCFSLPITLNILEALQSDWFYREDNKMISYALNDISNLSVVVNSATTAFLYFVFNRNYRELCVMLAAKWFGCCWCCCRRTRDRLYQRGDRVETANGRGLRSSTLQTNCTFHDGFEISDAGPYAVTIAEETDDDGGTSAGGVAGVRSSLLYGLTRKDISSQISSNNDDFHAYNNNNNHLTSTLNFAFVKRDS